MISIHTPARGATNAEASLVPVLHLFQSTRPRGARRTAPATFERPRIYFNPRARAGRDVAVVLRKQVRCISIHAPARGATGVWSRFEASKLFQSTRPRGARLWICIQRRWCKHFNPRARAGRDSAAIGQASAGCLISIHAPARGATTSECLQSRYAPNFNPRARAGRDYRDALRRHRRPVISIHAPARGATVQLCRRSAIKISIHAPARGATASLRYRMRPQRTFQSTRPRGARRCH